MEQKTQDKDVLQWHPAFFAGIQIELEEERGNLIFENEHQLGKKPMEIDVLIIKKEKALPIKKNIGRIFRLYNVIEYKSPKDYLSLDDFYKVYGYACFYKADTGTANEIGINEVTITFVTAHYPAKLIEHLRKDRGYLIKKEEAGIYYVLGDYLPIQIVVSSQLSEEQNLWLRSLTDSLDEPERAKKLIDEYEKHKNNNLYQAVINVVMRANKKTFQEARSMCEALRELIKDELDAVAQQAMEQGITQGVEQGIEKGIEKGIASSVLDLLSDLGEIPQNLLEMIQNEKNLTTLKFYLKKAAAAESIEEFQQLIQEP